jgi:hypothetical protein
VATTINPSAQSQVMDAAVAALNTTQWTAYRTRMASFPPDQLPAYNVLPDDAEPDYTDAYAGTVDWKFRFRVRCMAATVSEVDRAVDALFVAGSQVLLSDPSLGGLVRITRYVSQKWEREGEGELDQCALVVTFECEFGTSRSDPSVQMP